MKCWTPATGENGNSPRPHGCRNALFTVFDIPLRLSISKVSKPARPQGRARQEAWQADRVHSNPTPQISGSVSLHINSSLLISVSITFLKSDTNCFLFDHPASAQGGDGVVVRKVTLFCPTSTGYQIVNQLTGPSH